MSGIQIVTVEEMRALETEACQKPGLTTSILMENAGKSAADLFIQHLLPNQDLKGLPVLFLIGPGNNGGDGLVMARHLEQAGAMVNLYHWKERKLIVNGQEIPAAETPAQLQKQITRANYIIDALLGTGRSRPLPDDMRDLLKKVAMSQSRIVSLDLPTGLNADTGEVDPGAISAHMTITMANPKQGFFFFPGRNYIGDLYIADIGLPDVPHVLEMITSEQVATLLPPRPLDSHKGTFGKCLLYCGSPPYPGSAYLAGTAAARIGAGLVTLAVTEQMLPISASSLHETTFLLLPPENALSVERAQTLINHLPGYRALLIGPGLGQSENTRETILKLLEHLRSLPEDQRPRLLIDADGLNNLSAVNNWWSLLPRDTIITPHPAEMGRLCQGIGVSSGGLDRLETIAAAIRQPVTPQIKVSGGGIDRLELARQKAEEWQVNLVLKGACTIIAEPQNHKYIKIRQIKEYRESAWFFIAEPRFPHHSERREKAGISEEISGCFHGLIWPIDAEPPNIDQLKQEMALSLNAPEARVRINWQGNPLLATAGTGDVLAGMITGLLSQGMLPFDAATAGVYLHVAAADQAAQEMGLGRSGLLASDLLSRIPKAMVACQVR